MNFLNSRIKNNLFFLWTIGPMFLYLKNFGYLKIVLIAFALLFILLFFIKLFYHLPIKSFFDIHKIHKGVINFFGIRKRAKTTPLILLFSFFSLVVINVLSFSLLMLFDGDKNIFFSLLSLVEKVSIIFLFAGLFLLLPTALGKRIVKNSSYLVNFSFGLSVFMLLIFALSLIGYLYSHFILVFLVVFYLFSLKEHKEILIECKNNLSKQIDINFHSSFEFYRALIFIIIFFLLSLLFVQTLKPVPTDGDSLHVYFTAPLAYTNAHQYLPLAYSGHSSMGQNIEMIYAGIISLLDVEYVNVLTFLSLLLVLLMVFNFSKRFFSEKIAWLSVLFVLLMPMNIYFVTTTKVDLWQVFYLLIIVYLFADWQKEKRLSILLLIGWFSGIAIGIKYTSLIFLFAIYLVYFLSSLRSSKVIFSLALSVVIMLAVFSPWAIKNIYYFNAPLHPYPYFSFDNDTDHNNDYNLYLSQYAKARGREVTMFKHGHSDSAQNPFNIIKTIWQQSIGAKVMPAMSHNFGWLAFIVIIPLSFCLFKNERSMNVHQHIQKLFFIVIISTFLWHLAGNGGAWYIYFAICLLYILSAWFLDRFKETVLPVLFVMLIVFTASIPLTGASDWFYQRQSQEEIIKKSVPNYEAVQLLNSLLSGDNKLVVVGSFRVAYIDSPDKTIDSIDVYLAKTGAYLAKGELELLQYYQEHKIKYIMFSDLYTMFETWPQFLGLTKDEYLSDYSDKFPSLYQDIESFKNFLDNNTEVLYEKDGYYIYEIKH